MLALRCVCVCVCVCVDYKLTNLRGITVDCFFLLLFLFIIVRLVLFVLFVFLCKYCLRTFKLVLLFLSCFLSSHLLL